VRCTQAREALSAWYDGESVDVDPAAVAGHLTACAGCTAFQAALGSLADLIGAADTSPRVAAIESERPAAAGRPTRWALRVAIVAAGLGALVPAAVESLGRADHGMHESLAFTAAVSVALLCAAARPHLARGYLPVIGAASALLVLSSAVDVDRGRVAVAHELRHLGVLVGFVLVALLAGGGSERRVRPFGRASGRPTGRRGALRLITRSAVAAATGFVLVALVGLLLLVAPPASAHAMLAGSDPAADAVLTAPPTTVDLVFNESITLLPDSVRVFGPDGTRVDAGTVAHTHNDAATAGVAVRPDLPDGTYLVSYRVVSADSHPVEGAYTFVIGHPSRTPAAAPPVDGSRSVDVALGFSRWLTYAGSALGLGGFAFLVWCWPVGWSERRARLLVGGGVVVLTAGTMLALVLKGPYDAGVGLAHATDAHLLRDVLGTTYGRALDARLLLIAVLVLLLTYREHVPARWLAAAPAVLLAGAGVSFALCGHPAAGGHRPLAIGSDTVHVAAMSIWLGGLTLLLGAVLRRDRAELTSPVMRFSTLATGAVALLIASGTYQTLREVGSWDVLFHTHYGHVLLVKLGIVALAFCAASGSRIWVWQTMHPIVPVHAVTAAPPEPDVDGRPRLRRLRTTVGIESALLVCALVASAMLVTSDPAVSVPTAHPVSADLTVGPDRVRVTAVPAGARRVDLSLDVTDGAGRPTEPREIEAALRLPASEIGPLPVTLTGTERGRRTGTISVPIAGHWQLAVTVRTSAIDESTAYVDIPIP
jgi:copper transport protein